MMRVCRNVFAAVGAMALAASLSVAAGIDARAADATLDSLYEAAKAEGKVSVISAPNNALRNTIVAAFTARFPGIELEYIGMPGNPMVAKVTSEARGGVHSVDLVITGQSAFMSLKPVGLVRSLDPEIVDPDARDGSKWLGGGLAWADTDKTTVAMTTNTLSGVVMNSDLVKPGEITSDKDLLDPKWKGKIASNNPGIAGAANVLYRYYYDEHGPEFIKALKAQDIVVTSDLRQLIDWVAKGRYAIGVGPASQLIGYFETQGVKTLRVKDSDSWKDALLETPGTGTLSMLKTVPHPNAARLFANWLLTREGQTAMVKGLLFPSRRLDVDQEGVPNFMRFVPGKRYVAVWTEEFLRHPNQKKMLDQVNELKLGQPGK